MPINIYDDNSNSQLANLGEDSWELPYLLDELEKWVHLNYSKIPKSKYIADIGFDIRSDAFGGGGVLNTLLLKKISDLNMDIYFSEYPGTIEKE